MCLFVHIVKFDTSCLDKQLILKPFITTVLHMRAPVAITDVIDKGFVLHIKGDNSHWIQSHSYKRIIYTQQYYYYYYYYY